MFIKNHSPWNKGKKYPQISGSNHWNWKGGKHLSNGYIIIINKNHPFSDSRGRIFEHRVVMEQKLGRYLTTIEVVHHINGVKDDNRPENLKLFKNCGSHKSKEHPKLPTYTSFICENCKKQFELTGKEKSTRNGRFCSYQCFNNWRTPKIPCKINMCDSKIHARGLCNKHYRFLLRSLRKFSYRLL